MDKIKGAIFDLDGTLFDSLWVWDEIDKRFLGKRGIEVPPDYSQAISAMGFKMSAEYTVKRFGLDEKPENLMTEWMDMSRDIYANEIKLKHRAKEFLLKLHSKGIKLGIATSSTSDLYMGALKNNGVDGLFSVIQDTTNIRGKDFPDVYLAVARKFNLAPNECVVFEDLPVAIKSAKSGGFKTVAICDKHYDNELESIADCCVSGFDEMIDKI